MSTETNANSAIPIPTVFNKWAYGAFVALGLFMFIIRASASDAAMYMGLALVFDPFDQTVTWRLRPFYQKTWLIVHLLIVFSLFAFMILDPATK
jgi:hypothetical protein